jgi:aminopeptidase
VIDRDAFATLICDWCLEVEPGQRVLVASSTLAEPVLAALHAALLERGAWPFLALAPAGHAERILEHGQDLHLDAVNPMEQAVTETTDAVLRIAAPENTRALSGADPARLTRLAKGESALRELRSVKRWTATIWPTPALAQEASMSLAAYERFLAAALFLDRPDPIAAWRELRDRQQVLVDRLTPAREVRLVSAGTDITMNVAGRVWRNSDGRRNMPSGEVFTSPHEASVNGQIHFDIPSNRGTLVSGVNLTVRDGVVTAAHAEHGDARLQAELGTDAGARRFGEIGIGTNFGIDRQTGSTLLDEKIGGTVHMALGRSYPECGGVNESAIHWDLICDLRRGGEIIVDGEVISHDGRFV